MMITLISRAAMAAAVATVVLAPMSTVRAQDTREDAGPQPRRILSIGHHPRVDGIRLNYRDRELDLVRGANITIWAPYENYVGGTVEGVALGLPLTGASNIRGVGLGVFGLGAEDSFRGIGMGGLGVGAGGDLRGLIVGGLGAGAGGSVRGLAVGGLGVGAGGSIRGAVVGGLGAAAGGSVRGLVVGGLGAGAGGDARGLLFGGLGVGAGGSVRGITIGGLGAGAGGSLRGLTIAGVGAGAGGSVRGITLAGLGVGSGGGITGLTVAGLGIGTGGTLKWLSVAGLGIGAPAIIGAAAAPVVGAEETKAFILAPALFRTEEGGRAQGLNISSVNYVRGLQYGVAIGIVNYAERLRGVQLGAINIVRDNPAPFKVLPIFNFGRE